MRTYRKFASAAIDVAAREGVASTRVVRMWKSEQEVEQMLKLAIAFTALLLLRPAPALASVSNCTLTFGVSETPMLDVLQFSVDYSAVQGSFAGSGAEVECQPLIASAAATAVDA